MNIERPLVDYTDCIYASFRVAYSPCLVKAQNSFYMSHTQ